MSSAAVGCITTRAQEPQTTQAASRGVNGVYVLGLEGEPASALEPYLKNPDIDGFSLRAWWGKVEPSEGQYDWSLFDPVIALAAQHGKKVMLRVLPGARSPEWVYKAGAARFEFEDENPYHPTHGETFSMPVPWDRVYLEKWFAFVAAFGRKYADNPAVRIVAVTGPSIGGEMHLPGKRDAKAWRTAGYSSAALVEAWKRSIDAFAAAFPHQLRTVAIANPVSFGGAPEVVKEVIAYCAEKHCGIQGNWLAAKTPPSYRLYRAIAEHSRRAPVGFQMLSAAQSPRFGGKLATAVDLALRARACFLEVYKPDLGSDPAEIARAHRELNHPRSD